MCVCVKEREIKKNRERKKERERFRVRERERGRERYIVFVNVRSEIDSECEIEGVRKGERERDENDIREVEC
jgi:hypothetical protein